MVIQRKVSKKSAVKANNTRVSRRNVRANDDVAEVEVAPEATDLLFETDDVAELLAEVTGEEVAVTAEEDIVTFEVGDDAFEVTAEGDEEILETSTKVAKKDAVKASRKVVRRTRTRR